MLLEELDTKGTKAGNKRINYFVINKKSEQWEHLRCGHDQHGDNAGHETLENSGANAQHIIVMNRGTDQQTVETNILLVVTSQFW